MFDTIIVGGGAAGLATAVMLKQKAPHLNVAVFEQLDRVGKKISVTGNGRCNITNRSLLKNNFHSKQSNNAIDIINNFSLDDTIKFFSSIGVEIVFEDNKAYPRSLQAASVVDALRFAMENLGVQTFSAVKVLDIKRKNNVFLIKTDNNNLNPEYLKTKTLVIATGGLAGGSKLGSNGDGYSFLEKFGHKISPQLPVIVQVKTENTITKSLKGIKVNSSVTVINNSNPVAKDFGEVLFCDYGLSGPPILQLSRYCSKQSTILLDMFNDIDEVELTNWLLKRREIFKGLPLTEFFAGILHKRVGQAVLKYCSIPLSASCESLSKNDCINIAKALKCFSFKVTGNTGFVNAQATAGGAVLGDFNMSLMSKKCPALFAAGEVLDVDGDCGGYNLQWAWSSAFTVANGIIEYLFGDAK